MLKFTDPMLDAEEHQGLKKSLVIIANAIEYRSVLTLSYNGGEKLQIEPFVLGIHKDTGKYVLWCYKSYPLEFSDKKENWFMFEVDKIQDLKKTAARAKNTRRKFVSLSADLSEIIIEV